MKTDQFFKIRGSNTGSIESDSPILKNKESSADHLETSPKSNLLTPEEFDNIFSDLY